MPLYFPHYGEAPWAEPDADPAAAEPAAAMTQAEYHARLDELGSVVQGEAGQWGVDSPEHQDAARALYEFACTAEYEVEPG